MASLPFASEPTVRARALCLGARIDLRALETTNRLAAAPIVLPADAAGCAVLFRYGVAVLWAVAPSEERPVLAKIAPHVHQPFAEPQTEDLIVHVEPRGAEDLEGGGITVRALDVPRVQIVSEVLAKSVVLAHHEAGIAAAFDRIEPLAESLSRAGSTSRRAGDLLRQLGGTLLVQHRMVGRVEVGEKPEALWERPDLERLFARLSDEYEIRDRGIALERKLAVISQTTETLLELSQQKRSLRVEWYIVLLIVVEILLTVYTMLTRG